MALVAPLPGAYAVVELDPITTLRLVGVRGDLIAAEECRQMVCGKYIACITQPRNDFDMFFSHCAFDIDFVVQGLLPDDPATFYHHSMSVPIAPNTFHPTGRRSTKALPPLPWNDCYHTFPFHLEGRCAITRSKDTPQSCLSTDEASILCGFMRTDEDHVYDQEEARKNGTPISVSPIPEIDSDVQMMIKFADKLPPTTKPWWHEIIKITALEDEHLDSLADAPQGTCVTDQVEFEPPPEELSPFLRFTYDLSSFDSPPHPSGFLEELEQLRGIYRRYLDRRHEEVIDHIEQAREIDETHMAELRAKDFCVEGEQKSRGSNLRRLTRHYVDLALDRIHRFLPPSLRVFTRH
ncbi:hypothetical protein GGG16DRAFT_119547 [Schizophyllum commune]